MKQKPFENIEHKNIVLRIIAMMMTISVVCTSVPVYANEIDEYITEASDSESNTSSESPTSEDNTSLESPTSEDNTSSESPTSEDITSFESIDESGKAPEYSSFVGDSELLDNENEQKEVEESLPLGGSVLVNTISVGTGTYSATTEATETNGELTVILKGLTDENKQRTFDAINSLLDKIMSKSRCYFKDEDFIDAEKYNVDDAIYDANLCWAATASNILWITGYAKEAINPITGCAFASEDEVMAYFSEHFTDLAGIPDQGVNWFLNGEYWYQGLPVDVSQLKEDKLESGGLLHVGELSEKASLIELLDNPEKIKILDKLDSYGMGLLIRWLENGEYSSAAHWMTLVGAIIDKTAESIEDRYKAIIVANSDDDPVNGELPADYQTKLEAKAQQPNYYTVYKLFFDTERNAWRLNWSDKYSAYITFLYTLIDYEGQNNNQGMIVENPENPNEIYIIVPSGTEENQVKEVVTGEVTIKDLNYFMTLSTEQLEAEDNIQLLQEYMIKNELPVFSLSKGVVKENESYEAYIAAPQTFIYGVTIDGENIPFDQFIVLPTKSGLCKLIIKDEYLKKLLKGRHTLFIKVQGIDIPVQVELVIE